MTVILDLHCICAWRNEEVVHNESGEINTYAVKGANWVTFESSLTIKRKVTTFKTICELLNGSFSLWCAFLIGGDCQREESIWHVSKAHQ
jgi:hypothetical protein